MTSKSSVVELGLEWRTEGPSEVGALCWRTGAGSPEHQLQMAWGDHRFQPPVLCPPRPRPQRMVVEQAAQSSSPPDLRVQYLRQMHVNHEVRSLWLLSLGPPTSLVSEDCAWLGFSRSPAQWGLPSPQLRVGARAGGCASVSGLH